MKKYITEEFNEQFNTLRKSEEIEKEDESVGPNVKSSVDANGQELSSEVAPCGFFASTPRNWRGTLRRLARAGCINLGAPNISDPRLSAGAFYVGKKDGRLRLICDRRARNYGEQVLHKDRLPNGSRFSRLLLPQSHAMRLSGRDLKDFYCIVGVDAERYAKQCWGPRVPASWFNSLDDPTLDDSGEYEEWWANDLESIPRGPLAPAALHILRNPWP